MITPRDFVDRWANSTLREQQAAQSHFNELCQLVGHKTPAQLDPTGKFFAFEENVKKATGGKGRADVWYKGRFAWEYKGKHKSLDEAYLQLLSYSPYLENPPLLVVCDFLEFRIYPHFIGMTTVPITFKNEDLLKRDVQRYIVWLLENPKSFQEMLAGATIEREKQTLKLAHKFAELTDLMNTHRDDDGQPVWQPMQIARFLTKLVFALFAEDVDLLPRIELIGKEGKYIRYMVRYSADPQGSALGFVSDLSRLFQAMDGQHATFFMKPMPYFNGGIFSDSSPGANDAYEALDVAQVPGGINLLMEIIQADWRYVNPTIFGTLFEGALDPNKRAQLGAHYTGAGDINLVIEPVLMQPLRRLWDEIRAEAVAWMDVYRAEQKPQSKLDARKRLIALYERMLDALENTRVLDPACGSGNFLYMSLRALKDLETEVHIYFEDLGLPFRDVVTPRQLYGIEKDEFASQLAHVVVWMGYLLWRYDNEGYLRPQIPTRELHPRSLPHPIIQDKNSPDEPDRILYGDSILRFDATGKPYEPEWPEVDVIIGNPPFLGGKRLRTEIKNEYIDTLFSLYRGRVPAEADLVCYWYEKARAHIEHKKAKRAGLLATNSIRGGANRVVLDRIKQTGDIFLAWGDQPWVLDGASVRISIVGFDDGTQKEYMLDGAPVNHVNSDLQNTIDATKAQRLAENLNIAYMADTKGGAFDIPGDVAQKMIEAVNASGRNNRDVVHLWVNGLDITRRPRKMWIIDFGVDMPLEEAQLYEMPFQHVQQFVFPERQVNRRDSYKEKWWIHVEPRPGMRQALMNLRRYLVTPSLAKYRLFAWMPLETLADHQLFVFAREDDYFFGVLHSYAHEIWALRLGTSLEDRPRYTPSTTFETYAFPWLPGQEDTASPAHQAISAAAHQLHAERDAWLNPPQEIIVGPAAEKILRERTLTTLYNALTDFRAGKTNGKNGKSSAAAEFAPRLAALHDALDRAVLSAYGWDDLAGRLRTPDGDEELLRRLLALNLQRG